MISRISTVKMYNDNLSNLLNNRDIAHIFGRYIFQCKYCKLVCPKHEYFPITVLSDETGKPIYDSFKVCKYCNVVIRKRLEIKESERMCGQSTFIFH